MYTAGLCAPFADLGVGSRGLVNDQTDHKKAIVPRVDFSIFATGIGFSFV